MDLYETSSGNVIKRAFGKRYNISGTSLIKVYIKMREA